MKTLFSTTNIYPRDRFDYWHSLASHTIVDHDCQPQCRETFERASVGGLGGIGLVLFENLPMTVAHMQRHIAHANTDEFIVCRQSAGSLALEQDSREILLEAGDVTLLDPRLPYTGTFFAGSKLLALKVP